jgi:hypothetical protein
MIRRIRTRIDDGARRNRNIPRSQSTTHRLCVLVNFDYSPQVFCPRPDGDVEPLLILTFVLVVIALRRTTYCAIN